MTIYRRRPDACCRLLLAECIERVTAHYQTSRPVVGLYRLVNAGYPLEYPFCVVSGTVAIVNSNLLGTGDSSAALRSARVK